MDNLPLIKVITAKFFGEEIKTKDKDYHFTAKEMNPSTTEFHILNTFTKHKKSIQQDLLMMSQGNWRRNPLT